MSNVFKASQILQRTRVVLQLERLFRPQTRRMLYREFLEEELRGACAEEDAVNGNPQNGKEAGQRLFITIDHDCGRDETGTEGAVLGEEEDKPQVRAQMQTGLSGSPGSHLPESSRTSSSLGGCRCRPSSWSSHLERALDNTQKRLAPHLVSLPLLSQIIKGEQFEKERASFRRAKAAHAILRRTTSVIIAAPAAQPLLPAAGEATLPAPAAAPANTFTFEAFENELRILEDGSPAGTAMLAAMLQDGQRSQDDRSPRRGAISDGDILLVLDPQKDFLDPPPVGTKNGAKIPVRVLDGLEGNVSGLIASEVN